jgi:hypothetical protein
MYFGSMTDSQQHCLLLDFHGVTVSVRCDNLLVHKSIARDFSFFCSDKKMRDTDITIDCYAKVPPFGELPKGSAVMVQPHFIAYKSEDERWVDYHGRALCRYVFDSEKGSLWSEDTGLLWEKLYLLIHSRVGEILDQRGFHRVHAACLSVEGQGVFCMLPSGGGKTTLALMSLGMPGVQLLSDDTPLITRRGEVFPFPLRIGLKEKPSDIPKKYLRRFKRQEHGEKWLVDIEAFQERVAKAPVQPGVILLGNRLLGGRSAIVPLSRYHALPELLRSVVVGVGLPQLIEYFLRFDLGDVPNKAHIVGSRIVACMAMLGKSRVYRFDLSRDHEENEKVLARFLRELVRK